MSSSELPAGPPWTHSGLLFAHGSCGMLTMWSCSPHAQPPAPRAAGKEPVPAAGRPPLLVSRKTTRCVWPEVGTLRWQPLQIRG